MACCGRAGGLLLVDGVDEVPPSKRPHVREWLRELLHTFPLAQVVVTARPAAADKKWLAELNFSSTVLQQMSPVDVRIFLQRWHEAAGAPEEARRRLVSQLDSRVHLRSLASSPLLLRDLAWRLTLGGRSQLPTSKVHEHVARKIRSMPNVDEETDAVVTHLLERSGVIRELVPGQVDFVHRTFQEYLAARSVAQLRSPALRGRGAVARTAGRRLRQDHDHPVDPPPSTVAPSDRRRHLPDG
ncbi:NACHT domain-containing protein [Lentzea albidocapillata]|uniref:NACHT domain-containing protein n=1 Tax=Lentzea albidocapillata TaxID=40571 RepID=UPI000B7E46B7